MSLQLTAGSGQEGAARDAIATGGAKRVRIAALSRIGRVLVLGLLAILGFLAVPAWAASGTYYLYIDADADSATGCVATLTDRFGSGSESGFEYRLTVTVDAAGNAGGTTLSTCSVGSFVGADPVGQTAPNVTLIAAGANLLAQLELSVPAQTIGATPKSRMVVASDGDYINRLSPDGAAAITLEGASTGLVTSPGTQAIPSLSVEALAILGVLMGGLGIPMVRAIRRGQAQHWLMMLLLVVVSGSGLAAGVLVIDGNTDDWQGQSPLAADMTGDQLQGTADLHSLTARFQDGQLFLRIDTVEAANLQRSLSALEVGGTLPRFTTHPSLVASVGQPWRYQPGAADQAGQALAVSLSQSPAGMQLTGAAPSQQLAWTPTASGIFWVTLQAQDGSGQRQTQTFPLYVSDDRQLPVDPKSVATALSPTGFTPFAEHTAFLYSGANPIQTDMLGGAIDPVAATVVRGQVLDHDGQPLPGAVVRIAGHPEYGETRTRADGWYDLAANGGGWITVHIEKLGYMSAQRRFQAPWRDWAIAPEVVLLPYDLQYTRITAGAAQPQLYWGSTISDGRGDRRTSVYFPAGTQATAVLPDGSTRSLTGMNVRVSEYTVGSRGAQAMPAQLNMAVGYTWAANFTVDEAEVLGASSVAFSKPVVAYTDNFIDMPVGSAVPAGWYDFDKTAWIGENNGSIIKLLGVDAQGKAIVQVTTDEHAATPAELQALGFDDDELTLLARTRSVGAKLWRVRMSHFTPWDCNWPWGPPADLEPPPSQAGDEASPADTCPPGQNCQCLTGCEVLPGRGAVGQAIDLPGTPFSLYYRSDRVNLGSSTQSVLVTGSTRPSSLDQIRVTQSIAGQFVREVIPRAAWKPNQTTAMVWDGRDAYGRLVSGEVKSVITVGYAYPAVRFDVRADLDRAFERVEARVTEAGAYFVADGATDEIIAAKDSIQWLGTQVPELNLIRAGSWAIRGLRLYDPGTERVYEGGGSILDAKAPSQPAGFTPQLQVSSQWGAITPTRSALGANGALYFTDQGSHQIRRVWLYGARKGAVETVAGNGAPGYSGDGGPATNANLFVPTTLALAPDGAIVFMDEGNQRLRRIAPGGWIETIAGDGSPDLGAPVESGTPALGHAISASSIAVSRDMTVWAISGNRTSLRQISPGGVMADYALAGEALRQVVASPDGIVWLGTSAAIYQFSDAGVLRRVGAAGGATDLLPDREGGVYFRNSSGKYSHLDRAGDVVVLGQEYQNYQNVTEYGLVLPVATDPAGHVIGVKTGNGSWTPSTVVGVVGAGLPPYGESAYRIPRADGMAVDEFDSLGRPVRVLSTFGGQVLASYQYDASGQLTGATDSYGNRTTFERDASGRMAAVAGPFGQRTTLTYNGDQLSQVQQPGGAAHGMSYVSPTRDLLASYRDPRGGVDTFSYASGGRFASNTDPAGGGWTVSYEDGTRDFWTRSRSFDTTVRSAEGRVSRRHAVDDQWGGHTVVTTRADGTQSTSKLLNDGSRMVWDIGGFVETTTRSNDPRLGPLAGQSSQLNNFGNGEAGASSTGVSVVNAYDADAWYNPSNWRQTTLLHGRDSWATDYLGNGQFRQVTPMGRIASLTLNNHQQAQSATLPSGLQVSYAYNSAGQVTQVSSSDGAATRNVGLSWYGSGAGGGQLASQTNALGQTERFAYDAAGRLSTHTLVDGRALNYSWDAAGNLSSFTTPAGITHTFSYNAVQLPSGYTAPVSGATQWQYDRDRKLVGVVRPGGQSLSFSRLASGQLASLADSTGQRTSYSWRGDGRLASAATQDGQAIAYSYSGALLQGIGFNLRGTSASLGLVYERASSPWYSHKLLTGRISGLQLTAGGQTQTVSYEYDTDGLLTSSGQVQMGRDLLTGQLTALTLGKLATRQQHDAWGQLTSATTTLQGGGFSADQASNQSALAALIQALGDRMGATITQRGDCVTMSPAQNAICEVPAALPASRQTLAKQARASLTSRSTTVSRRTASREQLSATCTTIAAPTTAEDAAAANLPWPPSAPQWQSTNACQLALEDQIFNMLDALKNNAQPTTLQAQLNELSSQFGQGPSRFISASALPAPTPATFGTSYIGPQAQSLIDQLNATLAAWQANQALWATALGQTYARDPLGRVTQVSETLLGQAQPGKTYQYDSAGRLASASAGSLTTTWAYDANGNRTQENGITIATYNSQDQLQSWRSNTYSYNAAGDLTQKTTPSGSRKFSYDSQGNLRQVNLEDGRRIDYAIDPDNRRTGKSINGQLQWQLVWQSQLQPIARLKGDNTLEATYLYGDKPNVPEAMLKDGKTYRIVTDQLGSVRLVIDASNGDIAQQMAYDVWGNVTQDTNPGFQPFGYAGGLYDPDTQLTRFGARDYDAETGRWTAKDPILFNGGDSNLFSYANGNPLSGIDPLGLATNVTIWQPVGWGESSFGHVSTDINGTTYSFGPGGMSVMPTADYVARNGFRDGMAVGLKLTPQQEAAVQACMSKPQGSYSVAGNNCGSPIQNCLKQAGIDTGNQTLPVSLGNKLLDMGIVNGATEYPASRPSGGRSAPWAR